VFAEEVSLFAPLIDLNALALHQDFGAGLDRLLAVLRRQGGEATGPAAAAGGGRMRLAHRGKTLWLLVGAGVVVVLVVIALRGEGRVAEVLATALAIGAALLAMAWKADDAISLKFKRDLSLWLVRLDPAAVGQSVQRWPEHFAALFDRVFGKKHLSWRCFFRSSIASLLAFVLCTLIFMQAAPGEWTAFLHESHVVWLVHFPISGRGESRVYLVWSEERIEDDKREGKPARRVEPLVLDSRGKRLQAIGFALYFSLLSAVHIGWRDLNVGNWIARLQSREYMLRAKGWVRTVSGIQSLTSIYLLALWVLTYFGRPFE